MLKTILIYSEVALPLLVGIFFILIRKKVELAKPILIYFFVTTIFCGYTIYLSSSQTNNLIYYHFYSLFEVGILIPIVEWFNNKKWKLVIVIQFFYLFFWVVNVMVWENFTVFNSNSSGIAALLIVVFCLRHFLIITKTDAVIGFYKRPSFWFVLALLFFYSSSVLILSSYRFVYTYLELGSIDAWDVVMILGCIKYLLIIVSGICYYRQPYQVHSY